jgi:hypothetical protein
VTGNLKLENRNSKFKNGFALSLGERVDRDGAFISRRGPGEGFLPFPSPGLLLTNEAGFPLSRE